MLPILVSFVSYAALAGSTPTDPMALARLVGDAFFKESSLPPAPSPDAAVETGGGYGMLAWNYGGAL